MSRILIVDGSDSCEPARKLFLELGCDTYVAGSCEEARAFLQNQAADLVLISPSLLKSDLTCWIHSNRSWIPVLCNAPEPELRPALQQFIGPPQ